MTPTRVDPRYADIIHGIGLLGCQRWRGCCLSQSRTRACPGVQVITSVEYPARRGWRLPMSASLTETWGSNDEGVDNRAKKQLPRAPFHGAIRAQDNSIERLGAPRIGQRVCYANATDDGNTRDGDSGASNALDGHVCRGSGSL